MSPAPAPRNLRELLAGEVPEVPEVLVTDLGLDSRRLPAGALFLAVAGSREHGLQHLPEAIARGAAAVAWEPAPGVEAPRELPAVAVPHLAQRSGHIAARFFRQPADRLFAVGITGTDGKTSTAHLLAQALAALGRRCGYLGTLGYGWPERLDPAPNTTPDAVELQRRLAHFVDEGAGACAIEVSSHALVQGRINGLRLDCGVLTNVGRDHLDYHGSAEAYAGAKRRLFEREETAVAVLNLDDAHGRAWARELAARRPVMTYGFAEDAELRGENLKLDAQGLSLTLAHGGERALLKSPLLGRFNAANLLAVAAVLRQSGQALDRVAAALAQARTVPGRAEALRFPGRPLVVIDYAHTPQALEQILVALRSHASGRLYCVFGCGGDRDAGKRPLMGAVAVRLADAVTITDDNPRSEEPETIVADILEGIAPGRRQGLKVEHDRARAIAGAIAEAGPQDIVLIAGKGHEDYQIHGRERREFSDRRVALAHLNAEQHS